MSAMCHKQTLGRALLGGAESFITTGAVSWGLGGHVLGLVVGRGSFEPSTPIGWSVAWSRTFVRMCCSCGKGGSDPAHRRPNVADIIHSRCRESACCKAAWLC